MLLKTTFRNAIAAVMTDVFLFVFFALCFALVLLAPLGSAGATALRAAAPADQALARQEAALQAAYENGEVIRLHILAEDDGAEAQSIKLRVRDAVLSAYGDALSRAGAASADTAYALLCSLVEPLRLLAEQTARENGFTGAVTAEVGLLTLPQKRYGSVLLPRGVYRGLRMRLGKGAGQNWWCVLYPNLCLATASEAPWQTEKESPGARDTAGAAYAPGVPGAQSIAGAASAPSPSSASDQPEVVWQSERILSCWLAVAPASGEAAKR